jgi:ElaB/YqjD/DUF883 family membrane-anchored ribosome-binding protein
VAVGVGIDPLPFDSLDAVRINAALARICNRGQIVRAGINAAGKSLQSQQGEAGKPTTRKGHHMETHFENLEQAHSQVARERVLADLRALAHDSEELLKATAGDVSEKAREARARLSAALERTKSTIADLQQQAMAGVKEAAKKTDAVIREHPYESIGIALGVGLLIGLLVARK